MSLVYIFVYVNTPLTVYPDANYDDALFIKLGHLFSEGLWLGPYDQLTLIKGPGYPLFLAVSHWLRISVSLAHALFHCAAIIFFVFVANKFIRSFLLSGMLFALLLFHPSVLSPLQLRVVRDEIYYGQMLVAFAAMACALFCVNNKNLKILCAVLGGAALGWFWLTREEGAWILPALAVMVGGALICAYHQQRIREFAVSLSILIAIFAATQVAFRAVNWWTYGMFVGVEAKEASFERALGALQSVRSGGTKPFVSITNEAMRKVDEVSPAFRSLASYFDGPGAFWHRAGCSIYPDTCGEIDATFFLWALREAAASAGYHASPSRASTFYGRLANEIEAACAKHQLRCSHQLISQMPPWKWQQLADRELYLDAFNKLLLIDPPLYLNESTGSEALLDPALRFLNYPKYVPSKLSAQSTSSPPTVPQEPAETICLFILSYYQFISIPVFIFGVFAFLTVSIMVILKTKIDISYILALSAWVAVLGRIALLIFIAATSLPGLNYLYIVPAYYMLISAAIFSISTFFQMTLGRPPNLGASEITRSPDYLLTKKQH